MCHVSAYHCRRYMNYELNDIELKKDSHFIYRTIYRDRIILGKFYAARKEYFRISNYLHIYMYILVSQSVWRT